MTGVIVKMETLLVIIYDISSLNQLLVACQLCLLSTERILIIAEVVKKESFHSFPKLTNGVLGISMHLKKNTIHHSTSDFCANNTGGFYLLVY